MTGDSVSDWQTCALTDVGIRRKHNEDSVISRPEAGLWAVADGMGGHEAGDVASKMVVDALADIPRAENFSVFVDQVEDALLTVNHALREHAAREFAGRMMGTTVVVMTADQGYGACIWAGDSRLYQLRDGDLQQISRDHSQVQKLVDAGVLSEEEAESHPNANVITRAIGGSPDLVLDVVLFEIRPGDRFLLCSDGLYNEVGKPAMTEALSADGVEAAAQQLMSGALDAGARDNVSVIVVGAQA